MALAEPEMSVGPFPLDDEPVEEQPEERPDILAIAMSDANVAEYLDDEQLANLAQDVIDGFERDEGTMADWRDQAQKGIDLARMVAEEKTYPWPGAANAKYPLIAQAAMQFNARVYPALVPSDSPVHVKVWGQDRDGRKQARADRVREFMGFQLSVSDWEDQIDRLTVALPIVGTKFRKVFYDPVRGMQTRTVERVTLDNDCADLDSMPRISEEFELYAHAIEERIRGGRFIAFDYDVTGDDHAPHAFIEQHTRYDLDGDGYPEPYIVTLHKDLQRVVRVVGNFGPDDIVQGPEGIVRIAARGYYVPYHFVPSMDGTFMGMGLGHLLGNTSEVINGIVNQILDSGHLASLGGGFLGTGLNLKGGPIRLRPGEFKPVPAAGAAVRDAIVPMTFPGPSPVLFQMLGLLIEAGKDVAAISDVMTGDAPRQQPATTTLALIEQGMAVFTAAYKRLYRSLKKEFGLIARINAETVDPRVYVKLHDPEQMDESGQPLPLPSPQDDFDLSDLDIQPVADPAMVTNMQRMAKAQLAMELAQIGMADPMEAADRVISAAGLPDADKLKPKPDPMAQMMQQMMLQLQAGLASAELAQKHADIEKTISETEENRAEAIESIAKSRAEQQSMSLNDILAVIQTLTQAQQAMNDRAGTQGVAGSSRDRAGNAGAARGGGGGQIPDLRAVLGVGGSPGPMGAA